MWKYKIIGEDYTCRGWFIAVWGSDMRDRGVFYLYKDGEVREGAVEYPSNAFWSSEEEAITFYNNWSNT